MSISVTPTTNAAKSTYLTPDLDTIPHGATLNLTSSTTFPRIRKYRQTLSNLSGLMTYCIRTY